MLKGPLEADVQEASEACWTMDTKLVQVDGYNISIGLVVSMASFL